MCGWRKTSNSASHSARTSEGRRAVVALYFPGAKHVVEPEETRVTSRDSNVETMVDGAQKFEVRARHTKHD